MTVSKDITTEVGLASKAERDSVCAPAHLGTLLDKLLVIDPSAGTDVGAVASRDDSDEPLFFVQ